jgi:hypothetical protein
MRHLMDAFQQAVDEARRQLIRDEGQDVSVRSRSTAQVLEQVRTVALEVNGTWPSPTACLLARAVRFLADPGGIRQFTACGSGLPTAENTHRSPAGSTPVPESRTSTTTRRSSPKAAHCRPTIRWAASWTPTSSVSTDTR